MKLFAKPHQFRKYQLLTVPLLIQGINFDLNNRTTNRILTNYDGILSSKRISHDKY